MIEHQWADYEAYEEHQNPSSAERCYDNNPISVAESHIEELALTGQLDDVYEDDQYICIVTNRDTGAINRIEVTLSLEHVTEYHGEGKLLL